MKKQKNNFLSVRNKVLIAVALFFSLVLILASFFGSKGWLEVYNAKKQKQVLLEEIERLEKKKSRLERDILELETNPKAYELKARDQLGFVYPDELLIITKENPDPKTKSSLSKKDEPD
jgi:cell division protein FtsB